MKKTEEKQHPILDAIEKKLTGLRNIPVAVFLILSTIFNYLLGENIAKTSELYSNITETTKEEFIKVLTTLVLWWVILRVINQCVGKIQKHWLLDFNYMRWISKLTNATLSSISSVTTGAANSAINTVAQCDKGIVDSVMGIIPNIIPFVMLCVKEYKSAGIIPVIVNLFCIIIFSLYCIKIASNFECYRRQATARAEISATTIDCIKNSRTVKYFGKEKWSITRQETAQKNTFARFLAIPALIVNTVVNAIMWLPTVSAVLFCWEETSTVLYVIMMSYVIDNIAGYISILADNYTEKKHQLEDVLGKLEYDDTERHNIEASIKIKDVEFSYEPENKSAILFKIDSLEIIKGKRYCVTGKSGFGKSTLAKLLTGTNAPTKGNIELVKSVYMFAESEMFCTTIAENITFNEKDYDREEILDLLKALEIEVDLDIFNDSVGEDGAKLSTGQKQRINLARTIYFARRNPSALIVLDEVTAALDVKTSLVCLNYLTSEFERLGVTLVYISNKDDYEKTSLITDNIYVHKKNKIVTYDTVAED